MEFDLTIVFNLQSKLDKHIHKNHHVKYSIIKNELKLALIVELAELANEIKSFKFWSFKKPSKKNIILEEYADALHFITSLGIYYKIDQKFVINNKKNIQNKKSITKQFILLFKDASNIINAKTCYQWYKKYLQFALQIGFSFKQIINAYKEKCLINHNRQNNNY